MMKKSTFTLLFSLLLIVSCLLASCNTNESIFGEPQSDQTAADTNDTAYEGMIRDLENQIVELQQSQYISNAESQKELARLQELLAELTKESEDETQTSPDSGDSENTAPETPTEDAKFLYTTDGNTAVITGYTGDDTHLVIPAVIDGYTVTAIADNAFESGQVESVIVSSGIQKIGWFAFQKCEGLVSVTIPASVQSIGFSAFAGAADSFTVYAPSGSFAQQYAQSYGLRSAVI